MRPWELGTTIELLSPCSTAARAASFCDGNDTSVAPLTLLKRVCPPVEHSQCRLLLKAANLQCRALPARQAGDWCRRHSCRAGRCSGIKPALNLQARVSERQRSHVARGCTPWLLGAMRQLGTRTLVPSAALQHGGCTFLGGTARVKQFAACMVMIAPGQLWRWPRGTRWLRVRALRSLTPASQTYTPYRRLGARFGPTIYLWVRSGAADRQTRAERGALVGGKLFVPSDSVHVMIDQFERNDQRDRSQ